MKHNTKQMPKFKDNKWMVKTINEEGLTVETKYFKFQPKAIEYWKK